MVGLARCCLVVASATAVAGAAGSLTAQGRVLWGAQIATDQPVAFSISYPKAAFGRIVAPQDRRESLPDRVMLERVMLHEFQDAALDEWVAHYRKVTGLEFRIDPDLRKLAADATKLQQFKIGRRSVRVALDLIAKLRSIGWRYEDGVVHVLPVAKVREAARGTASLKIYAVADLALEGSRLAELVRMNVAPETWSLPGRQVEGHGGNLIVAQDAARHREVESLLLQLRRGLALPVAKLQAVREALLGLAQASQGNAKRLRELGGELELVEHEVATRLERLQQHEIRAALEGRIPGATRLASLADALAVAQMLAEVPVLVTGEAGKWLRENAPAFTLELARPMRIARVLDAIVEQTGGKLAWQVRDGAVFLGLR